MHNEIRVEVFNSGEDLEHNILDMFLFEEDLVVSDDITQVKR
jgi:hypothetical protein